MNSLVKALVKRSIPRWIVHQRLLRRGENYVTMTFDDGPDPDLTPKVLDLLDEYDAQACFFVIGKAVDEHPELFLDILRRGHVVGNHTFSHPPQEFATFDEYRRDVIQCQLKVFEMTGQKMIHFRPPRGQLSIKALRVAKSLNLHTVLWSCMGGEYRSHKSDYVKSVAGRMVSTARDGDICVLHDDNPHIVEILKIVLPGLKERGFKLQGGAAYL